MDIQLSTVEIDKGTPPRGWREARPASERPLSPRERQIHQLIGSGLTRKEVAFELSLSDATVRVLYARAMRKLGLAWQARTREQPRVQASVQPSF
jgi:DNA-binding NarL/FixJ family response regulator